MQDYWDTGGGSRLKDYRDLDQHYFTLCKHVVLQWSPEERVLVFLPDDPTTTAEPRLTFDKELDALRYFVAAFNDFHQCVERVAISLGFKPTVLDEQLDTTHLGNLDDGVRQTLGIWVEDSTTGVAIELGQTEDRTIYVQRLIPTRSA